MEPEEFKNRSDVLLYLNRDKLKLFGDEIEKMDHGREIMFNATLKSLMLTRANQFHIVMNFF